MNFGTITIIITFILTIVSVLHLVRAWTASDIFVGSWSVPVWVSWILFLIAGCLAYHAWKFGSECNK